MSPTDRGLLYGLGSFETVRLYAGIPFLAERHDRRLIEAAAVLGIAPPPYAAAEVLAELSRQNGLSDARGRIVLTGGEDDDDRSEPHYFAEVAPLPRVNLGAGGVSVIIAGRGRFSPISGIKSLSYLANYLARSEAGRSGANEALLTGSDGELLEGATSNLFLIVDGALVTPATDGRILPGITRGVVLEEARALGIPTEIRPVRIEDLPRAREAFLTSSLREVLPVRRIETATYDAPGPLTRRLLVAYRRRVADYVAARSRRP